MSRFFDFPNIPRIWWVVHFMLKIIAEVPLDFFLLGSQIKYQRIRCLPYLKLWCWRKKKRCLGNIWRIDFQISKIALHSVFSGKILIKLISTALNCARGCWRISRNNGISPIPPVFNGPELLSSDSGVLPLCPTRTTLKLHNILVNFKLVNSFMTETVII